MSFEIRKAPMGIEINIPFNTDLGNVKHITVNYSKYGINPSFPGSLNDQGMTALKEGLILAEILLKHKYMMED